MPEARQSNSKLAEMLASASILVDKIQVSANRGLSEGRGPQFPLFFPLPKNKELCCPSLLCARLRVRIDSDMEGSTMTLSDVPSPSFVALQRVTSSFCRMAALPSLPL
jgi:hypothetical protein